MGEVENNAETLGVDVDLLLAACDLIKTDGVSCAVIRGREIIHTADGRGVAPLLALYHTDREKLDGSCVVDRIIGKAAAMILALGNVKSVYGEIMSLAARDYLTRRGVPFRYGRCVEVISAQTGDGICPMENSVLDLEDPEAGLVALTQRIAELRQSIR